MVNNMNIEYEGYTREQILDALFSSARKVRYEYLLSDSHGFPINLVEMENVTISYDSRAEIKRTLSGTIIESTLVNMDSIDMRLTPYFCLTMPDGREAKWKLGVFIIVPQFEGSDGIKRLEIEGYDLSKIPSDDKLTRRFFVPQNANYISTLKQLLGEDIYELEIEDSEKVKLYDQEWEPSTSKLTVANEMLAAINYDSLHFNADGMAVSKAHVLPMEREIDFSYIANQTSVIVDGVSMESDKFDMPNKWVRYTENPDAPYLYSEYINDDEDSPYSTVNRGRTIVDAEAVDDIASQQDLDALVIKIANQSMQSNEVLTFTTLNMPCHDFQECLYVECEKYGIGGTYIETQWEMSLEIGGTMSHVCERVVQV